MQKSPSTPRIFLNQIFTFGVYFLVWCYHLGKDLKKGLGEKAVPSLWWVLAPGGIYYWMWHMTQSLEVATAHRIKHADTFLLYVVLSGIGTGGIIFIPDYDSSSYEYLSEKTLLTIALIIIGLVILAVLVLHAVFIAIVQRKLDKVRSVNQSN